MYTALSVSIRCPFYIRDNPKARTITCEGAGAARTLQQAFRSKKALMQHADRFCKCEYEQCPYYQIIRKKYSP